MSLPPPRSSEAEHRPGPVKSWTAPCPTIDPGRVLRLHGYRHVEKVRPVIRRAAADAAARAQGLVAADARWRRVPVETVARGAVRLGGGGELECPAFDDLLDGAAEIVVFVLTLGPALDRTVADLTKDGQLPLEALFLETAGRLAIEKLTRMLAGELGRLIAQEGLALGPRLGPGYSYRRDGREGAERMMWPLEQQHALFALFGGAPLPVDLMESAAMLPKMSRSGIMGVHQRRLA